MTNQRSRVSWTRALGGALLAAALLVAPVGRAVHAGDHEAFAEQELGPEEIMDADARLQPNLRPIYSAKTDEKVLTLTFDISWGNKMAPKVLDVLKQEGVKATFFLSSPWARDHVELVKRIIDDGHDIQSHGHRHDNLNQLGYAGAAKNISTAHKILTEMAPKPPSYIRPPNGAFNKESVQAAKDLGYATVMWSVDSLDWKNPGVETIIRRSTRLVHPGAIILMHASDSCKQTDMALPTVLQTLKQQGYKFVTVDDLIRTHGVDMNGFIHVRPNQKS